MFFIITCITDIGFQFEILNEKNEEPVSKKAKIDNKTDDIADTVTCSICQEIMHDCVRYFIFFSFLFCCLYSLQIILFEKSLQPCLHSYCSGCYSDWMEKSELCPICRLKVDRISKNHIVNNLIEAYLKLNPEKKRSDESIAELETKNKITHDMVIIIFK